VVPICSGGHRCVKEKELGRDGSDATLCRIAVLEFFEATFASQRFVELVLRGAQERELA